MKCRRWSHHMKNNVSRLVDYAARKETSSIFKALANTSQESCPFIFQAPHHTVG